MIDITNPKPDDDLQLHLFQRLAAKATSREVLYHYTGQDGLRGILASHKIWCTDIRFLNDSREVLHSQDLVGALIEGRLNKAEPDSPEHTLYARFRKLGKMVTAYPHYVASFSEEGDLLSQWRAYGGQAGYAIGFEAIKLLEAPSRFSLPGQLMRCVYDPEEQSEHIRYGLDYIARAYLGAPSEGALLQCERHFYGFLLYAAACFKHPSFSEEKEWRLVFRGIPDRKSEDGGYKREFRTGSACVVPYIEVPLDWKDGILPVKVIIAGPSSNIGLACDSLGELMEDSGLSSNAMVAASHAPYRGW